MMCKNNKNLYGFGFASAALIFSGVLHAAPGVLSDQPLFLGTSVQPNIFFVVDDSGSMDWEVLKSTGAQIAYSDEGDYPNRGDLDMTPTRTDAAEMLESCVGYNVMYYDPNIEYTPWAGVDEDGNTFQNQRITAARRNPYDPDEGTVDLTEADGGNHPPGYFVWNDADNDGEFDIGECPDPDRSGFNYQRDFIATTSEHGHTEMTDAQKTNFANWYSYYRKREYVAKKALSEIINDSTARVGLATLHNNNSVGTIIQDIDNISSSSSVATAYKNALLENLFRIYSRGGTPLRSTLKEVGEYFEVGQTPDSDLFGFSPSPTSPILSESNGGACQQNFTVMMSDGYWNGDAPSGISNHDGDRDSSFDGGSYADTYEDTLADVAMHYYERDLATGLDNVVPVTAGVDENTAQHMVSYMVAFGITGTLDDNPSNRDDAFTWPAPWASGNSDSSPEKIDDMRHAAWNGRGEFLNAKDSQELIDSLSDSIASIQNRTGSASAVAFNTTSVTVNTYVYQARFDSGNWSGTLQAFEFDENGVGSPVWDAGELLEDENYDWEDRNIFTYRTDTNTGIPFEWPSNYHSRITANPDDSSLNNNQILDLLINSPFDSETTDPDERNANAAYGEAIVNYLKGDQTNAGGGTYSFRDRQGKRLGDIVHSSPEYVGVPAEPYPNRIEGNDNLYSDFRTTYENRRDIVYVGANDGMLHAFDADTGREVFAYIPGQLFGYGDGGLHKLAEPEYNHLAYVDGSAVSRDVFVNDSWKTYLIGSYRAGGKGVYVLDVTDPSRYTSVDASRAEDLAVMEFTDADMGYSFSKPQIARMNNGKWAAIFGNGYNSDPTGDGTAKLFILYLDGSGYETLETNVGTISSNDCSDSSSDCNGLSSPSIVDVNNDFMVDRIYAGDLHGNMWVFDVSSSTSASWGSAFDNSGVPAPLFTACSADPCTTSNRQPITSKPIAVGHPTISSAATFPNVIVLFGTGQYIAENDNSDTSAQSFYGVWDAGNANDEITRANLTEQEISVPASGGNVSGGRVLTDNSVSYNASTPAMGWYIDLPTSGERVVVDPVVASDLVFFNTTIPEDAQCSAGGSGYLMAAQIRTGGQPSGQIFTNYSDGANNTEIVGEYSGIPLDAVPGGGTIISGDTIVISDSLGRVITTEFSRGNQNKNSRRASWSVVK